MTIDAETLAAKLPVWPSAVGTELDQIGEVLSGPAWGSTAGHVVKDFEREFAAYHEADHAFACCNGTIALMVALGALNIDLGSEIIVPSYTFIATAAAPVFMGYVPVFCDTAPGSYLLDPDCLESLITEKTKAIIPVHLAGAPCDMAKITAIADKYNIPVIEDAAQAAGVRYRGRPVPYGQLATFSFQSSKNIPSGEGGAVVTRDPELAEKLYSFINVGRVPGGGWYEHRSFGMNLRLTEVQGAILRSQLSRHQQMQAIRQKNAELMHDKLSRLTDIVLPPVRYDEGTTHGQHLFMMCLSGLSAQQRGQMLDALHQAGLAGASSGYIPLHKNHALLGQAEKVARAFGRTLPESSCPNTDHLVDHTIWLPQNILLADSDVVAEVAQLIADVYLQVKG